MKRTFRYNRQGSAPARPLRGYVRWLRFWGSALARLLRTGTLAGGLVWIGDDADELLAAGFPSLLAVPGPLFAETAALLPDRLRLRAAGSEEELLAAIRLVEGKSGERFDWDAFLAACEKRDRRGGRLRALSRKLAELAPPPLDARTPHSALRSLSERKREI